MSISLSPFFAGMSIGIIIGAVVVLVCEWHKKKITKEYYDTIERLDKGRIYSLYVRSLTYFNLIANHAPEAMNDYDSVRQIVEGSLMLENLEAERDAKRMQKG